MCPSICDSASSAVSMTLRACSRRMRAVRPAFSSAPRSVSMRFCHATMTKSAAGTTIEATKTARNARIVALFREAEILSSNAIQMFGESPALLSSGVTDESVTWKSQKPLGFIGGALAPGRFVARGREARVVALLCQSRPQPRLRALGSAQHWQIELVRPRAVDGDLVAGVGMAHDAARRIVGEDALQTVRRLGGAVADDDHAGMLREADAGAAAIVHRDPSGARGDIQHAVEERPIGDGVGAVAHRLGLAVGAGDRSRIEVIAADDDRRRQLALRHHLVEGE